MRLRDENRLVKKDFGESTTNGFSRIGPCHMSFPYVAIEIPPGTRSSHAVTRRPGTCLFRLSTPVVVFLHQQPHRHTEHTTKHQPPTSPYDGGGGLFAFLPLPPTRSYPAMHHLTTLGISLSMIVARHVLLLLLLPPIHSRSASTPQFVLA